LTKKRNFIKMLIFNVLIIFGVYMASSQKVFVVELDKNPEYQRLLAGEPETCGMRSGRVYLEPGKDCGQHSTKGNEELLVFLSGSGELIIGENEKYEVGFGKVSYIPPHTDHNVKNSGSEPLVYIFCVAPASE
jgi:mannose-6-phosphate isomerase-like protein (cupin superfamily)